MVATGRSMNERPDHLGTVAIVISERGNSNSRYGAQWIGVQQAVAVGQGEGRGGNWAYLATNLLRRFSWKKIVQLAIVHQ